METPTDNEVLNPFAEVWPQGHNSETWRVVGGYYPESEQEKDDANETQSNRKQRVL